MTVKQVSVGMECYTKIGGDRVKVRVTRETFSRGRTRYFVARLDTGRELPKPRVPSALHDTPGPWCAL